MMKIFRTVLVVMMMIGPGCSTADHTYVSVVFDVEDYITPACEGIDDIPGWLAGIMTETGVTGTFFVIGEKARSLEARGRQDVIQAMAAHDIGSHTNLGSIHPTVTEILEKTDWDGGVQQMLENESKGFDELERIFGVPVTTFARHGGSYGPQLVHALGRMDKAYVYSPIHLPGHNAVWFCNTLNFHGEYGGFDDLYYKDELFDPFFDSMRLRFQNDIRGLDVVAFFGCHPCKVRTEQFWDFNYYEGANPPLGECKAPDLRPLESMETARKNFRRLMQFLASEPGIRITTFSDLSERFSYQRDDITRKELAAYAGSVVKNKAIIPGQDFSPAEMFAALVASLDEISGEGKPPAKQDRISPLGPLEMPPREPGIDMLTMEQVFLLAAEARDMIISEGTLPAWLLVGDSQIGTGSLLVLFCDLYLDVVTGNMKDSYRTRSFDPYPVENEEAIVEAVEACKHWPVHNPDLDMSVLVEKTRLQLWTLKPAREAPGRFGS